MEDVNHRVETLQRGMYNADTKTEQLQREKDVLQSQIEDLVAQASVGDRAARWSPPARARASHLPRHWS